MLAISTRLFTANVSVIFKTHLCTWVSPGPHAMEDVVCAALISAEKQREDRFGFYLFIYVPVLTEKGAVHPFPGQPFSRERISVGLRKYVFQVQR